MGQPGFPSNPARVVTLGRSVDCPAPNSKTAMEVPALHLKELLRKLNATMQEGPSHKIKYIQGHLTQNFSSPGLKQPGPRASHRLL